MHTIICLTDPHYQVKIMQKTGVPLASVQLEVSTTYTSQNDHYDTGYATIPMIICEKQHTPSIKPKTS